ncbi:metallophosphoesterase family protein [Desulfomarina sp.]
MKILLLSDIHANFPALKAVADSLNMGEFDTIVNAGDSIVYGPFPNQTLSWLQQYRTLSILGNTDKKVLKLLKGKTFKKPVNPEKRIMYTWTADSLAEKPADYLQSLPKSLNIVFKRENPAAIFHGSPAAHHEFLFQNTPDRRFLELAEKCGKKIIITGHSHTPYYKFLGNVHFINPGSVGRMFDGDPRASFAVMTLSGPEVRVTHHRIPYDITETTDALARAKLPGIYSQMFLSGRKLN